MALRPWRDRSMAGPRNGATTANGAIVRSRERATRPRAASGEMLKNSEPARAMVTSASPPMLRAWVSVSREKPLAQRLPGPEAAAGGRSSRQAAPRSTRSS